MEHFTQTQWPAWAYPGLDPYAVYNQVQTYPTYIADSIEAAYQSHQQHLVHHHQMSRTTESKPRLSKEEVEVLEAEFQKNHKPNSSTKKALAESMRVDNARINNWFQNRRAREKKENNIRAYEARQKLEKEKTDGASDDESGDEAQLDIAPSSAPFPEPRLSSRRTTIASSRSEPSPDTSTSDNQSETGPSVLGEDISASPHVSVSEHNFDDDLASVKLESSSPTMDEQLGNNYLHASTGVSPLQPSNITLEGFASLPRLDTKCNDDLLASYPYQSLIKSDAEELGQSFPQQTFSAGEFGYMDDSVIDHTYIEESGQHDHGLSPESGANLEAGMQLKTPPPGMDIASRRNRRPPPLSINGGSRSYSYSIPKTAVDFSKRNHFGNTMRRVASVNGMGRISKASAAGPRSPFSERKAEGLMLLNRSPTLNGPKTAIAPPTPHLSVDDALASGAFALSNKASFSHMVAQDPTLRTPPTTPGVMDQLFNLNAPYDSSLSDEPLATPGLGHFPEEFELPNMSVSVPDYLGQACTSQPETPLYAPHMGPAYFGYAGGNAEYNWSEGSSTKSSPGQNSQRVQFMNMTASHFS